MVRSRYLFCVCGHICRFVGWTQHLVLGEAFCSYEGDDPHHQHQNHNHNDRSSNYVYDQTIFVFRT